MDADSDYSTGDPKEQTSPRSGPARRHSHRPPRPKIFQCPHCERSFDRPSLLGQVRHFPLTYNHNLLHALLLACPNSYRRTTCVSFYSYLPKLLKLGLPVSRRFRFNQRTNVQNAMISDFHVPQTCIATCVHAKVPHPTRVQPTRPSVQKYVWRVSPGRQPQKAYRLRARLPLLHLQHPFLHLHFSNIHYKSFEAFHQIRIGALTHSHLGNLLSVGTPSLHSLCPSLNACTSEIFRYTMTIVTLEHHPPLRLALPVSHHPSPLIQARPQDQILEPPFHPTVLKYARSSNVIKIWIG